MKKQWWWQSSQLSLLRAQVRIPSSLILQNMCFTYADCCKLIRILYVWAHFELSLTPTSFLADLQGKDLMRKKRKAAPNKMPVSEAEVTQT